MMDIINDQLQSIDCGAQMEPFNLAQLSQMITTLEQKRQGFNDSCFSRCCIQQQNVVPKYTSRF